MSNYGELPKLIERSYKVDCNEMMFYQDMLIKQSGDYDIRLEKRLGCFRMLVGRVACDYVGYRGLDRYKSDYMYICAKHMWQSPNANYNRPGWHSDGFMTDDINYIWSNTNPTVFNVSKFNITQHDTISLQEMEKQAEPCNNFTHADGCLLRLNQFNIHRVGNYPEGCMRTFVKVTFSKDRYNRVGNSHNYEIDYDWELVPRNLERNIPQAK